MSDEEDGEFDGRLVWRCLESEAARIQERLCATLQTRLQSTAQATPASGEQNISCSVRDFPPQTTILSGPADILGQQNSLPPLHFDPTHPRDVV
ncbi:Hypp8176 [Branchiostoma lanceolatum]|uniref:Hypp8176 protein n=1 Tax=Branchiostoma lanceolatum TaxID=7740 RepID=A0A8J9Z7H6_BRALA|nr:Hypp8176 [Branchiostoma lanceolatum]